MITKKQLKELKEVKRGTLKNKVIDSICNRDSKDIQNYMEDVMGHGCESGIVTELIYYVDTEKFFKKYASEILEILENYTENVGCVSFELTQNNLAWFAYEQVLYDLYYEVVE